MKLKTKIWEENEDELRQKILDVYWMMGLFGLLNAFMWMLKTNHWMTAINIIPIIGWTLATTSLKKYKQQKRNEQCNKQKQ